MFSSPKEISEKHIIGKDSTEWLVGPHEVASFNAKGIEWAGLSDLTAPYEIVRHAPIFGHVLACTAGEGEVFFDGDWRPLREGMVFVSPPFQPEALRAVSGRRWRIAWVHTRANFFNGGAGVAQTAFLAEMDGRPLHCALEGLRLCLQGDPADLLAEQWSELVFAHAHRLAGRAREMARLGSLWEKVARAPGEPWDVARLSALAGLSREHLRRVAFKETGRTPKDQVAYLRMQKAASLLRFTRQTMEAIAEAVGYRNPFVFSNAFTRIMGQRPSAYRVTRRADAVRDRAVLRPADERGPFERAKATPTGKWMPLDLRGVANQPMSGDGRSWFGLQAPPALAGGRLFLQGVPCELIADNDNERRSMVAFASRKMEECGLSGKPREVTVRVDEFCAIFYVLHTAAWVGDGVHVGVYTLQYADGGTARLEVSAAGWAGAGAERAEQALIQDWWAEFPPLRSKSARSFGIHLPGVNEVSRGWVHLMEWINPHPGRRVSEIVFAGIPGGEATLGLLAVTALRQSRGLRTPVPPEKTG